MSDEWSELAYVMGRPGISGLIRSAPTDFDVEELLGFEPDGDGEHALLCVRKTGLDTIEVARRLARFAGVPPREVGYCGLKDRHAVAAQWFSVRLGGRADPDWSGVSTEDLYVFRSARHGRKLRKGTHRGNRFRIVVRDVRGDDDELAARMARVGREGAPNYVGEQRFGRDGRNLAAAAAMFDAAPVRDRFKRGMYLSAARAFLFNEVLCERVRAGTWNRLLAGDVANLAGSRSVFQVADVDAVLANRVEEFDIHPTGPLYGTGASLATGEVRRLEESVLARHPRLCRGLERFGLWAERRPLRMRPAELCWEWHVAGIELRFTLNRGEFATALLRECVDYAIQRPAP